MSCSTQRTYWPSPQDYSEAIQTPRLSFDDPELRDGVVETTSLGLPRCMSGNYASVFCFQCPSRKVAVRCFLHDTPDQQLRYRAISSYVLNDDLPYTVPFEYLENGIRLNGKRFPLLKMEWVDGITINQFISQNLSNSVSLKLLASYFKQMTLELHRAGIAHGDLQHDNIMFAHDELRLVDYDGMFVPALNAMGANELGHPNYQHPSRSSTHFGVHLDNFSAWIIYTSIQALSKDPSLWRILNGGNDCLLFRQADFTAPSQSQAFKLLENHPNELIRRNAFIIKRLLDLPLDQTPPLDTAFEIQPPSIKFVSGVHAVAPDLCEKNSEKSHTFQVQPGIPSLVKPTATHSASTSIAKITPHKQIQVFVPGLINCFVNPNEAIRWAVDRQFTPNISPNNSLVAELIVIVAMLGAAACMFSRTVPLTGLIYPELLTLVLFSLSLKLWSMRRKLMKYLWQQHPNSRFAAAALTNHRLIVSTRGSHIYNMPIPTIAEIVWPQGLHGPAVVNAVERDGFQKFAFKKGRFVQVGKLSSLEISGLRIEDTEALVKALPSNWKASRPL